MFERFTDRARRVVVLAQEEARLLGHNYIGTEHILLGLIAEGEGVAARVLEQVGISLDEVRTKVESIIGEAGGSPSGHIPFTPRAKKVLELSLREALQLGHNYIGTEHILLGLIREGQGVAAQVLTNLGADLSVVRQSVIELLAGIKGRPISGMGMPALKETPAMVKARTEARRLAGGKAIGSHHQLLALMSDEDSLATKTLTALGVAREQLEAQLSQLDPAGTSDETPEEAGARRIGMRVEGKLLMLEIDDPELAESVEKAMQGRKLRIIKGSDPEATGFADLWSTVSRTVDDVTRRLTTRVPPFRRTSARRPPPDWDSATRAAFMTVTSTPTGLVAHFEVGKDVDREAARAWLRGWLDQNRAQLLGPSVERPQLYSSMWAVLSRAGEPFGMQNFGFETQGGDGEPVALEVLIDAARADLAA